MKEWRLYILTVVVLFLIAGFFVPKSYQAKVEVGGKLYTSEEFLKSGKPVTENGIFKVEVNGKRYTKEEFIELFGKPPKITQQGGILGAYGRGSVAISNPITEWLEKNVYPIPIVGFVISGTYTVLNPHTNVQRLYEDYGAVGLTGLIPYWGVITIPSVLNWNKISTDEKTCVIVASLLTFAIPFIFAGLSTYLGQRRKSKSY